MSRGLRAFGAALTSAGEAASGIEAQRRSDKIASAQLTIHSKAQSAEQAFKEASTDLAERQQHWKEMGDLIADEMKWDKHDLEVTGLEAANALLAQQKIESMKRVKQMEKALLDHMTPEQKAEHEHKWEMRRVAAETDLNTQMKAFWLGITTRLNNRLSDRDTRNAYLTGVTKAAQDMLTAGEQDPKNAAKKVSEFFNTLKSLTTEAETMNVQRILEEGQSGADSISARFKEQHGLVPSSPEPKPDPTPTPGLTRAEEGIPGTKATGDGGPPKTGDDAVTTFVNNAIQLKTADEALAYLKKAMESPKGLTFPQYSKAVEIVTAHPKFHQPDLRQRIIGGVSREWGGVGEALGGQIPHGGL